MHLPSSIENATPSLVQAPGSSKPPGSPLGPVCVARSPKVQAPGSSTPPGSSLGPVGVAGSTRENAATSLVQARGSSKPPGSSLGPICVAGSTKGELLRLHGLDLSHGQRDAIPSAGSREFYAYRRISGPYLRGWIHQSSIVNATPSLVHAPVSSTPPGSSLGPISVAASTKVNGTPSLVQAPGISTPPGSSLGPICVAGSTKGELLRLHELDLFLTDTYECDRP
ncbi:uncharacterized protein LOC135373593 [Ornithodoros turicata]|uniref:uncharacterized protein LOC135373593 n=1 Tax=Ornithodoros turicata TaxID=34597 RepID=UPI0031393FBE